MPLTIPSHPTVTFSKEDQEMLLLCCLLAATNYWLVRVRVVGSQRRLTCEETAKALVSGEVTAVELRTDEGEWHELTLTKFHKGLIDWFRDYTEHQPADALTNADEFQAYADDPIHSTILEIGVFGKQVYS